MSCDKPFRDQTADVDAVRSATSSRAPCGAMGLPDWVHAPAEKVDQPKRAPLGTVDTLMTVEEVAAYLRVSTKTVRRQIAAGHIQAIRIGRSIRVSPEELACLGRIKYQCDSNSNDEYRE
ncbi:MAG: helix-turn-helix domain-containing protein [Sphingomonadaceae bacterium]|nr:helix-turn-helix domain-containing protein [Sphingomonadaceae bacterium]